MRPWSSSACRTPRCSATASRTTKTEATAATTAVTPSAERACPPESETTGMMTDMQQISKAARARSGPTPEFVELCKTLYGDAIDPTIVWTDVIKLSPDQADLAAQRR